MYLQSPKLATIKVRLGMMLRCRPFQSISIANRDKKLNRKPIQIRNSRVTLMEFVVEKKSHAGFSVLFSFFLLPFVLLFSFQFIICSAWFASGSLSFDI